MDTPVGWTRWVDWGSNYSTAWPRTVPVRGRDDLSRTEWPREAAGAGDVSSASQTPRMYAGWSEVEIHVMISFLSYIMTRL